MFHFVCDGWQNRVMCLAKLSDVSASSFSVKLDKSATKPPEMLHEAFGELSFIGTAVFEWH
jgi:hypothetical protein